LHWHRSGHPPTQRGYGPFDVFQHHPKISHEVADDLLAPVRGEARAAEIEVQCEAARFVEVVNL
jgi:hypothetical protein